MNAELQKSTLDLASRSAFACSVSVRGDQFKLYLLDAPPDRAECAKNLAEGYTVAGVISFTTAGKVEWTCADEGLFPAVRSAFLEVMAALDKRSQVAN